MVIYAWGCNFASLLSRFIRKFAISFLSLLCVTFHVIGPRRYCFCIRFPWISDRSFFLGPSRNPGFEHISVVCHNFITDFITLSLSASQIYVVKKWCLFLPDQRLSWEFSKSVLCFLSWLPVWYRPHTLIGIVLLLGWQRNISQFFFQISQPCSNWAFSNCLSHNSPARGWPYRFLSRGTTGSSILDNDFSHLCRGRRIQMSGHSDSGIFSNLVGCILHFYLGISRYCIRCLSCATRQSGDDIHDFSCCHLRCWWSLFSENCIRTWIIFYNVTSEYDPAFVPFVLEAPAPNS